MIHRLDLWFCAGWDVRVSAGLPLRTNRRYIHGRLIHAQGCRGAIRWRATNTRVEFKLCAAHEANVSQSYRNFTKDTPPDAEKGKKEKERGRKKNLWLVLGGGPGVYSSWTVVGQ
jgi:hypothetical protein